MVSGMIGADIVALQSFARELERAANDVAAVRKHVNSVVVNHNAWFGPNYGMFLQRWGQLAIELTAVQSSLDRAARTVSANAQAQGHVSGSLAAGGAAGTAGAVSGDLFGLRVGDVRRAVGSVGGFVSSVLGCELGFGQSIGDIGGVVDKLSKPLAAIGLIDVWNDPQWGLGQKLIQSAGMGVDAAGGAMMSAGIKGNPVLFGVGMATTSWSMAIQAAGEADFSSEGMTTVAQEIARDPGGALAEVGTATVTVLTGFALRIGGAVAPLK